MPLRLARNATEPRLPSRAAFLALAVLVMTAPPPASAEPITSFEGFPPGENGVTLFRQPTFSGSTDRFLARTPDLSVVTDERASDGAQSLLVSWQFLPGQTDPWLRLTTFNAPNLPNPALDLSLALQFDIFVPRATPDFYVTLGVRETGTPVPIGTNGGTVGSIEFVGATSLRGQTPIGRLIPEKDTWVTVSFEIPFEPVQPFTGNGRLDVARGVLEQLAFTPVSSSATGPYVIYLDNVRQVAVVPEPGTAALVASCLMPLGVAVLRRRRA